MKAKSLVLSVLAALTLSLGASFVEASDPIVYARVEFSDAEQSATSRRVYIHWVQTKNGGGSLNVVRLRHRSIHSLNEAMLSIDAEDLALAEGRNPLEGHDYGDVCLVPVTEYSRSGPLSLTVNLKGWDCTVSPTP